MRKLTSREILNKLSDIRTLTFLGVKLMARVRGKPVFLLSLEVVSHVAFKVQNVRLTNAGADLGGGYRGCAPPPLPPPPLRRSLLFVLAFKICLPHRSVTSFLRGAPPPNKNPGSAPGTALKLNFLTRYADCLINVNILLI